MKTEDFKFSKTEYKLIEAATTIHRQVFEKIQDDLPDGNIGVFMTSYIEDYLFEVNYDVLEGPKYQIVNYWDCDVDSYIDGLFYAVKQMRSCIINLFLIYVDNEEELTYSSPSWIKENSMYETFGTDFVDTFDAKRVADLSDKKLNYLNDLLVDLGMDKISDKEYAKGLGSLD